MAEVIVSNTDSNKKGFIQNFIETIKQEIRDISYVEIVTAVGDVRANVNPDAELVVIGIKDTDLKIKARTRIELDGDIMVITPGTEQNGQTILDKEIIALHKENVAVAVTNWNIFMQNMFTALKLIMDVTGLTKGDVLNDFKQPVASITQVPTSHTDSQSSSS